MIISCSKYCCLYKPLKVADHICKLAKKGLTPSQIGVILRDSHGIGQVKSVTGSKVLRILKGHGMITGYLPLECYQIVRLSNTVSNIVINFCNKCICSGRFFRSWS